MGFICRKNEYFRVKSMIHNNCQKSVEWFIIYISCDISESTVIFHEMLIESRTKVGSNNLLISSFLEVNCQVKRNALSMIVNGNRCKVHTTENIISIFLTSHQWIYPLFFY